jgi:hypothetical protein
MLEILFLDMETGKVNYGISNISLVRYITPSEIGFTYQGGRESSCAFTHNEKVEIMHATGSPMRAALMREVSNAVR